MNRFNLASAVGLFVLAAGLASCSQEQTSKDSYKTPPPVIMTGKGQQGLLQWERSSDKTLDVQDAFDVSAGNPTRTEVLARCMRDKTSFTEKFSVNGRRPVKIFQIVPQDVLFENLDTAAVTCDWEVSLYNEIGSRHVIRLATSPLSDRGNNEVILENAGNNEQVRVVRILKTAGVKVRYRNSSAASAEVVCRDVSFDHLPFEKVLELSQIDLRRPIYRRNRNEESVTRTPLQPCRILIHEEGQVRQISPLITIHIPRRPLEIKMNNIFRPLPGVDFTYFFNHPTAMADISIHNSTDVTRIIQIPRILNTKANVFVGVKQSMRIDPNSIKKTVVTAPWIVAQLATPIQVLKDEPAGWTVSVPSRSSLILRLNFKPNAVVCFHTSELFTAFLVPAQSLTINEIMPTGEQIESVQIPTPEIQWGMTPEQFENTPWRSSRCL